MPETRIAFSIGAANRNEYFARPAARSRETGRILGIRDFAQLAVRSVGTFIAQSVCLRILSSSGA